MESDGPKVIHGGPLFTCNGSYSSKLSCKQSYKEVGPPIVCENDPENSQVYPQASLIIKPNSL